MSSGRGGGEGLALDASDGEFYPSVHKWHLLSHLLTGWVGAPWGPGVCEKEPPERGTVAISNLKDKGKKEKL